MKQIINEALAPFRQALEELVDAMRDLSERVVKNEIAIQNMPNNNELLATKQLVEGRMSALADDIKTQTKDQAVSLSEAAERRIIDAMRKEMREILHEFTENELPRQVQTIAQNQSDEIWRRVRQRLGTIAMIIGGLVALLGWTQAIWRPYFTG